MPRRKKMMISSRIKFWALLSLLVMGGAARGDAIDLKSAVRLDVNDRVVHLRDIADLTGPHARNLADLVIAELDTRDAVLELTVRDIRRRLDEASVHWGIVQLNGRKVVVRPGREAGTSGVLAMQAVSLDAMPADAETRGRTDARTAADLATLPTLRGAVAAFITAGLRRPGADIRLVFDRSDDDVLDLPRNAHRIEIEPTGTLLSDRLGLHVRQWEGVTIVARHDVTVGLLLRTHIAVPVRDIARDEQLGASDIDVRAQWLKPSEATLAASRGDTVGHIASRRLDAGAPIARTSVQRETVMRRGDLVVVRCLVGGAVIAVQAEARGDGSAGDAIEFRKKGERDVFLATIVGPGEAIVDLSVR